MSEALDLHTVADQYRQEGYTVAVRPFAADLPDFLASYHPGLIARKNGSNVVVRVAAREELVSDPKTAFLAAVVNAQPGWRFDLVVHNPKAWPEEVARQAAEPT